MSKKKVKKILDDLRESARNGVPWSLTFSPCGKMTQEQREQLEAHLKCRFENWRDTWIIPRLDQLEAYLLKPARKETR